jgi:hypothetical protein
MALAKDFAECFECIVTLLLKIELYIIRPLRDLALAEGDVRDKKYKNLSLYLGNIVTL